MAQRIADVMTGEPVTLPAHTTMEHAARRMRDDGIGDILVSGEDGSLSGILTDRDIAIRAVADGQSPSTRVGEIASSDLVTLSPDDRVADAVHLMRERSVRRAPVVQDDQPVGIVSIGDLAVERDPDSVLADISASRPNE